VIGTEPVGSPTLRAWLDAKRLVALNNVSTRVPTMVCRRTDEAIFQTVIRHVDDIVLVTDDEMQAAPFGSGLNSALPPICRARHRLPP